MSCLIFSPYYHPGIAKVKSVVLQWQLEQHTNTANKISKQLFVSAIMNTLLLDSAIVIVSYTM